MSNATNSQLDTVESLLASERSIASTMWTVLNEMRWQKQLPDWVLKMDGPIGSHAQMEVLGDIQRKTDIALTGLPDEYEYLVWDEKRNTLASGFSSICDANKAAEGLRSQYPKARVVRLHRLSDDLFTLIERVNHG